MKCVDCYKFYSIVGHLSYYWNVFPYQQFHVSFYESKSLNNRTFIINSRVLTKILLWSMPLRGFRLDIKWHASAFGLCR